MPFDGLVLASIRRELENLVGGRVEQVQEDATGDIILLIRRGKQKYRLLWSVHPRWARVHLVTEQAAGQPSFFCTMLRRCLVGGRLTELKQPGFERILRMYVAASDDLGRSVTRVLIGEFMGRHANLILTDQDGTIIDARKRYTHQVSRYREVLPGVPYLAPPVTRKNLLALDEEAFAGFLLGWPLETPVAEALQSGIDGLGMATAREVVFRAGLPPDARLEICGAYELSRLWSEARRLYADVIEGKASPTFLFGPEGTPLDFAADDLTHLRATRRVYGKMNEIVAAYYAWVQEKAHFESLYRELHAALKRRRSLLEKKLDLVGQDLAGERDAARARRYGELILTHLHRIKKGHTSAALEDLEQGETVVVPLRPELSPAENAQAYFKAYAKTRNRVTQAQAIMARLKEERTYLDEISHSLALATRGTDLDEIREEMEKQGFLRGRNGRPRPAGGKPCPLLFRSSDGFQIFVGKNNHQNDYITFKIGRGGDIWLHARGVPGAHVLITTGGKEVSPTAIAEAAALAAYYSRARDEQHVPVDYTLRKYVRKPQGARPGFVVYSNEKTITVTPGVPAALESKQEAERER